MFHVKHFKIIFLFIAGEKNKIANCVEVFFKKTKTSVFLSLFKKLLKNCKIMMTNKIKPLGLSKML